MRAQDEAEYAEFVAAVTHRVHRVAYAVCGDRQLAEDAVQSALISAYRTWPRVRNADSSEAYLRKMVVNQLFSWRRRKSWGSTSALGRGLEPSRASHENAVVEHQRIWSAVGELPPRQRAVSCCATTRECRRPRSPRPSGSVRARSSRSRPRR